MLYQDLNYQLHEDIQLMHHELLLRFQYDQLNVEIPIQWQEINDSMNWWEMSSYLHVEWRSSFAKS